VNPVIAVAPSWCVRHLQIAHHFGAHVVNVSQKQQTLK